jgi:hypothetical protein
MQQVIVVDSHTFVAKSIDIAGWYCKYFVYNNVIWVTHIEFDYCRRVSGDSIEIHF